MKTVPIPARTALLRGEVAWQSADTRVLLVDDQWTPVDTVEFLSGIPSARRIATSTSMTGKSVVDGEARANDVVVDSVPSSRRVGCVVVYLHTGADSSARVLHVDDTLAGLPYDTQGANILIDWGGADVVFDLNLTV